MISKQRKIIVLSFVFVVAFLASMSISAYPREAANNDTIISLITIHPGSDIYELEGHCAIRIQTPKYDVAINYGTFDFNAPHFVYRFVKGETDYFVSALQWSDFRDYYIHSGRRIVEQEILLHPKEKEELIRLISRNLLPENCYYRYNYVKDNCATRPFDIIDWSLDTSDDLGIPDKIELGSPEPPLDKPMSYREIMAYYHKNYPWYQFGIDLALGCGIDYEISNKEKMFAPVILEQQLRTAVRESLNKDISNDCKPLVYKTNIINDVAPDNAILPPTSLPLRPISVFSLLLLLTLIIGIHDIRKRKITRWYYALIFSLLGIVGLILTFLIFVSTHEATSPNFLYIFFNPLCLIVPLIIYVAKLKKILNIYMCFNAVAIILGGISWPFLPQVMNPATTLIIITDFILTISYLYNSKRK